MSKHRTRTSKRDRLLSGILCLALVLGLLPAAGLVQTVRAAHWAEPYGRQLVEWGVMNPSSDLRLGDRVTRAEFVAMCNRTFGYKKLGGMPFTDVPSSAWYAQDIDIAYNAGYFNGTASNRAAPNDPLTREQAAVLLARNMMLQETVGESMGFTDSRDLSEWSRGLIGAAVAEGMISGYTDGSYRPFSNITRGEVAAMLVRAIGNPINSAGSHEMGSVYGNVTISSSNATLRNTIILGNLYVTGGVDLGNVLLENVTVLGRIVVSGGGVSNAAQSSVILRNVAADELVVDSMAGQFVTVSAYGINNIPLTYVRTDAYLEDSSTSGYGLSHIELVGENGTLLQLSGSIKEVVNKTPFSDLQLVRGTAEKITVDEYARGSRLLIDINTRVDELNLDVATRVTGEGDIVNLNIGASGSEVDILPEHVEIRPGLNATIDGELVNSTNAAELSSEPRLLAGYPAVSGLTPIQAEGLYSGNKPGTIYWAVSEMSDGSVSVEDLISNPAYGGNIFESNAGSIDAVSKTEYGRQITKLAPDGSYYVSAILVDGRGSRSPLKVVSFTTPDDTQPAFVEGYPYMSRVTCEVAQFTAMANKSCTLYWVLLPAGAAAPTAQQFKSGSVGGGGSYGYGSQSVAKNVPVSITANTTRLQEDTYYDLYLWLNDFDGAKSSEVIHVTHDSAAGTRYSFRTPDETPPIVATPYQSDYSQTAAAAVTFAINEAPSTLYWAVVAEGNESFINDDMSEQRQQLKVEFGSGSIVSGSKAAAGAGGDTEIGVSEIKGLDYKTYGTHSFRFYYVAKDAAGNYSEVGYIVIHTLDADPPHAWLEYSDAVNGSPQANSDIRIVFDEQVQGGVNATQTFLEFYEAVENAAAVVEAGGNEALLTAAKNNLARELAAHIKLYYSPRNGAPVLQTPRHELASASENWVIDFREAVIEMENGKLVITLSGDGADRALNLDSGANYQFRFVGVYDTAFTPNGIAVNAEGTCVPEGGTKSETGSGTLYFSTLYAQVELRENTSVSKIDRGSASAPAGTRLDMVVDVVPQSTEKVPDTEFWDLIMWSDTIMTVEVYRQVITLNNGNEPAIGDGIGTWQLVSSSDGIEFIRSGAGRGLNENRPAQLTTVKAGLEQGKLYRYGVHITYIGNVSEGPSKTEEPESWGDLVTMRFSLIAGTSGNVSDVSNNVNNSNDPNSEARRDRNYNEYLRDGKVSEIGIVYTGKGTESILSCSKQFRDTQAPAFRSAYPAFTVGSGAITMQVSLDRPGTVYYVVAPVDELVPETVAGTLIGSANDGSAFENIDENGKITDKINKRTSILNLGGPTYIPNSGSDRETFKDTNKIFFTGKNRYHTPDYLDIYNGETTYRRNPNIKTGYVEVESASAIEYVTVTGLQSEKWYYVYFVLEGGGDPSKVVEIYRARTTEPQVPNVIVTGTSTSVTIEVTEDCEMAIALVEYNSLPSWLRGNGAQDTTSPLYQMMYRDAGQGKGPSLFDASNNTSQKTNVLQYVLGTSGGASTSVAGSWKLPGVGPDNKSYNEVVAGTLLTFDLNSYMTSTASEYVVLVVARQVYGGTTINDYGYGATRGLYTQDKVPPSFQGGAGNKPGYLTCSITKAIDPDNPTRTVPNSEWTAKPSEFHYNGSVTITFSKDIYCSINLIRYTLTGGGQKAGKTGAWAEENTENYTIGLVSAMSGSTGKITEATINGRTVTLTFSDLAPLDSFVFFGAGSVANQSNFTANGALTLLFNPAMHGEETMTSVAAKDLLTPGFYVSWGG